MNRTIITRMGLLGVGIVLLASLLEVIGKGCGCLDDDTETVAQGEPVKGLHSVSEDVSDAMERHPAG